MVSIKINKIADSKICKSLSRMTDFIYESISKSAFGRTLTNYDSECENAGKSEVFRFVGDIFKKFDFKPAKRMLQASIDNSYTLKSSSMLADKFLLSEVRQYGIFLFSFALFTMIGYVLNIFSAFNITADYTHLIFAFTLFIVSIPMLFSKKSLCGAVCDSRIASFLLFYILGINKEYMQRRGYKPLGKPLLPYILGLFAGILSFLVPPVKITLGFLYIILMYMILISPESGMLLTISFLPFLSGRWLALSVLYISFSFFIKVVRGKRIFRLELADFAIMAYAVVTIAGALFSVTPKYSFAFSIRNLIYIGSYFLLVNMVRTRPWVKRMTGAVIFSLLISVACGLIQKFAIGVDFILVEELVGSGSVQATFNSPDIFATYILLCIFFLFAMLLRTQTEIRLIFVFFLCVASVLCLYYTSSPFAWLAFLCTSILFFLIYSNRTIIFLLCSALIFPFAKYILPSEFISKISEMAVMATQAFEYKLKVWNITLLMMRDNLIGGGGNGTFSYLYNSYAAEGMESLSSAHNIYLQNAVELGICGLFTFLVIVFVFIQNNFSFFAKRGGGKSTAYAAAGFSGAFGLLLLGLVDNVWQDARVFLAFWIVLGLTMAIKRQSLGELRGMDEYIMECKY